MDTRAIQSEFARLLREVTGQGVDFSDALTDKHARRVAGMVREGAPDEELEDYAAAIFADGCVRGINVQAAAERAGVTLGKLLVKAGRTALGLP
jgi:hypothetical protein